jgi:vancomycin permeability regulator SanA
MEEVDKHTKSWRTHIWQLVKKYKWIEIGIIILAALVLWAPTIYANLSTRSKRYDLTKTSVENIPQHKVAIVFGAGISPKGEPTPYLRSRIETAVELYKAKRVHKILMSGDNSTKRHNEPVVMGNLAEKLGVPKNDIVLDYAGFNSYDSCYRAKAIFNVHDAILVSQGYHLPRAVMTCSGLGVSSIAVAARHSGRDFTTSYIMREWLSTDKAMLQLISKPNPTVLGKPEPV